MAGRMIFESHSFTTYNRFYCTPTTTNCKWLPGSFHWCYFLVINPYVMQSYCFIQYSLKSTYFCCCCVFLVFSLLLRLLFYYYFCICSIKFHITRVLKVVLPIPITSNKVYGFSRQFHRSSSSKRPKSHFQFHFSPHINACRLTLS